MVGHSKCHGKFYHAQHWEMLVFVYSDELPVVRHDGYTYPRVFAADIFL